MTTLTHLNYQLRDYQRELFQNIFAQWDAGNRRLLMQLPTGAGKTVLFSAVSGQFTERGEGVLVLAHREELLFQAKEKLESVTGVLAGLIKAGYPLTLEHPIQIASVQSLIRRKHWPNAGLVIVDEAHHSCSSTYVKILERYQQAFILGVTATPARSDGHGFKKLYDALILGRSVRELISAGYLCKFRLFAAPNAIKTAGIKITAGDFNRQELADLINTTLTMGDVIQTWRKHAQGKKTVIFCVDVAHSKAIASAYCQSGIPAEHLDGETTCHERKAILERFRLGETLVLSNCNIVSEGFDLPDIEAVQCLRPTRSLTLYLQMMGRGLRPAPGKTHLVILDHTENWIFHGLPDEEREWGLNPLSLSTPKWAIQCPTCNHIFKPLPHEQKSLVATCPNCEAEIQSEEPGEGEPMEQRSINNDVEAQLQEINLETNPLIMAELERLKNLQERHGYKTAWVYHQLVKRCPDVGLPELRECAKLLGYKSGWAWHRWQDLQLQANQLGTVRKLLYTQN